jgi:hypothetical protein
VRDHLERYMKEHAGPEKAAANRRNDLLIWKRHPLPEGATTASDPSAPTPTSLDDMEHCLQNSAPPAFGHELSQIGRCLIVIDSVVEGKR